MAPNNPNKALKGTFKNKQKNITIDVYVQVIEFEEDGCVIIYCPSLNLSGYGKTEKEAQDSIGIVMDEFLEYTTTKGSFEKELKSLGWKSKAHSPSLTPPQLEVILRTNSTLRELMNTKSYKVSNRAFSMPAVMA